MKTKKEETMKDYFEFHFIEKEVDGEMQHFIDVEVHKKGKKLLEEKAKQNPDFNEEEWFSKLITKALERYIIENEKKEAGEIEEE